MLIVSKNKKCVVNLDNIELLYIEEDRILATSGENIVLLGKYDNATEVLHDMVAQLHSHNVYEMPE